MGIKILIKSKTFIWLLLKMLRRDWDYKTGFPRVEFICKRNGDSHSCIIE